MSCLTVFSFIKTYCGFFLGKDEYRDLFLSAKETMFFLASALARFLPFPLAWALPPRWQKLCHRHGKKFAKGAKAVDGKIFLLTDSEVMRMATKRVCVWAKHSLSEAIIQEEGGMRMVLQSVGLDG